MESFRNGAVVLWAWLLCAEAQQRRDCALRLPASSPSFAFNGIEGSEEADVCISYEDVSDAFLRAAEKAGLNNPPREYDVYSLGLLGTALQETTRLLADRFSLSRGDIAYGLPRIDTLRTRVADFCPRFLRSQRRRCEASRYRRHDGACNNPERPTWGSARASFRRFLPPDYADGVSEPRAARTGFPLPNARAVSALVHRDASKHDHTVTFLFVVWGQLVDHDLTLTAETRDPVTLREPDCCGPGAERHPNCLPVELPPQDPFYRRHRQRCFNLLRSLAGVRDDCRLGPRAQTNAVTSYLDGSVVYGSSEKVADELRLLRGGQLRTLPIFRELGLKNLLPLKIDYPEDGCIRPDKDVYCFLAGDNRVNEQVALSVLHTMLARQHNDIAGRLAEINPHWDDERLYQEARHIVAALMQHITYSEFLPLLLGKDSVKKYSLEPRTEGYADDYDPRVDATVTSSFITAAFRFGHSLLPSAVERWSVSHKFIESQRLSEVLKRPYNLYKPGWYDQYVMGLVNQVSQAMDDFVTQEVTNHLFQQPLQQFGMDLAAINVQRAREHGVPSYNQYRSWCGLPLMERWSNMLHAMPNSTVHRYNDVYDHPDDIDLWSAGVAEQPAPGSMVGPTFNCLIARTFRRLRTGDRFWYENPGQPGSFTPDQLETIRSVKLSRLLCDSGDRVETIQVYSMALPDAQTNPRVSCKSRVLARLDLSKWREDPLPKQVTITAEQNIRPDSQRRSYVRFPEYIFLPV
ncbi:peroxidase-like [Bacillus rossius redtenbacheri]|uniref:peroxidase-like n=1 Tax=Bacillus rossius redtenbacheri TaxID=93214 RepID=UPI002FDE9D09